GRRSGSGLGARALRTAVDRPLGRPQILRRRRRARGAPRDERNLAGAGRNGSLARLRPLTARHRHAARPNGAARPTGGDPPLKRAAGPAITAYASRRISCATPFSALFAAVERSASNALLVASATGSRARRR